MAKMRVSQHSGRVGSASHNDRTFLKGKTEKEMREMAPHINAEAMQENTISVGEGSFREQELAYYQEHYSSAIEATNDRYRAQGHPERCKTVDQIYQGAQTRPEEMILQIGNRDDNIDPGDFEIAVGEYLRRLEAWNHLHGNHMHILNWAIHVDEASPHVHIRRVWDYQDKDGLVRLGQNKALKAAGVPLPHPEQPEGRYNNRKITFDQEQRAMWQKVVRSLGYEIETDPVPNIRHKDKADYINDQLRKENTKLREELQDTSQRLSEARKASESLERDNSLAKRENTVLRAQNANLEARVHELDAALSAARQAAQERQPKKRLFREPAVEVPPEEWTAVKERAVLNSHLGTLELRDQAIEAKHLAEDLAADAQQRAQQLISDAQQQSRALIESANSQRQHIQELSYAAQFKQICRDFPEVAACCKDGVYQGRKTQNTQHKGTWLKSLKDKDEKDGKYR